MIRFLSAGESHGRGIVFIIDSMPAGVKIDLDFIGKDLCRRQSGYGRGKRMAIEKDRPQIISGVRHGRTIGSPIAVLISNKDYENWSRAMSVEPVTGIERITVPRPGHADLPGFLKYGFDDMRNVLERASARETAARVGAGAICKLFLKGFDVRFFSHTVAIGRIRARNGGTKELDRADRSPVRCIDQKAGKEMVSLIDRAVKNGDTLGGIVEVIAKGACPGIGSYVQYDKRLDARIAMAMLSIPSVKGVEIGDAFKNAARPGSSVHDEIVFSDKKGFFRRTNNAGGIEGGMSNGEDIIVRLAIKPIPTLGKPLNSVDIRTKKKNPASKVRADTCIVPAAGVIAEAMLAIVLADGYCEKFGGDCMSDTLKNYGAYKKRIKNV